MKKPIEIEDGEWWFRGNFIQKQDHPLLNKYVVFSDTEQQQTVGTTNNFATAKNICIENEVIEFKFGYKAFLG